MLLGGSCCWPSLPKRTGPPWVPGLEFKGYVIRDVDCTTCCDDFDMTSKDGRRLWSSTCGVPTA
jgi:hypothetical protein